MLKAKDVCEALGRTYDSRAVARVVALERMLERRLPHEQRGGFAAILNALEYQVEEGAGDTSVVRPLGEALLSLARVHQLDSATVSQLTRTLDQLHCHISARTHRSTR